VSPLIVLIIAGAGAGIVVVVQKSGRHPAALCGICLSKVFSPAGLTALAVAAAVPIRLGRLFLSFLEDRSLVFGSGYVLLHSCGRSLSDHLHWLTEKQLIDSVPWGNSRRAGSPTATFIGYLVGAWPGAAVATLGCSSRLYFCRY